MFLCLNSGIYILQHTKSENKIFNVLFSFQRCNKNYAMKTKIHPTFLVWYFLQSKVLNHSQIPPCIYRQNDSKLMENSKRLDNLKIYAMWKKEKMSIYPVFLNRLNGKNNSYICQIHSMSNCTFQTKTNWK